MATLTEPFTYSDGNLVTVSSSAWTNVGTPDVQVVSGKASTGGTGIHGNARALPSTYSSAWEIAADIDCGTNTDDANGTAIWVTDAGYNGYGFYICRLHMGISEITGGVAADVATFTATTGVGVAPYLLTRTAGGLLTMYRYGVPVCSGTDTTTNSVTQTLIIPSTNDATTLPTIDNLLIPDSITPPAAVTPRRPFLATSTMGIR